MLKHIVCFGDSNTHGYRAEDMGRFDEETRWTARLCRLLGPEYLVIEEGLSGRTTSFEDPVREGMCGLNYIVPLSLIHICPTGALREKESIDDVLAAIADPSKHVIVQTAPAVRAGLGEEFGYPIGTNVEGKMAAALRRLGFDKVFDTNFSADLTIMEEAHEFIERVQNGGVLPMITSCSPGWIKYCEHYFPDMTENLSSCKSPQQMFGAIAKSYYAEKMGLNPADIVSVSIMPCTAKKFEVQRPDEAANGVHDVDYSLDVYKRQRKYRSKVAILCFPNSGEFSCSQIYHIISFPFSRSNGSLETKPFLT